MAELDVDSVFWLRARRGACVVTELDMEPVLWLS